MSLFQRTVRLAVVRMFKAVTVVGRLGCSAKVEHTSTDV